MGRKFKIRKDFQDRVKDIDRFMRSKGLDEKFILDTEQLAKNKGDLRKGLPLISKAQGKHVKVSARGLKQNYMGKKPSSWLGITTDETLEQQQAQEGQGGKGGDFQDEEKPIDNKRARYEQKINNAIDRYSDKIEKMTPEQAKKKMLKDLQDLKEGKGDLKRVFNASTGGYKTILTRGVPVNAKTWSNLKDNFMSMKVNNGLSLKGIGGELEKFKSFVRNPLSFIKKNVRTFKDIDDIEGFIEALLL